MVAQPETDTLELGSTRRRGTGLVVAAAVGLLAGAGATAWWSDRGTEQPATPAASASRTGDVRLVLTGVRPAADGAALTIDAVLLHSRTTGTATVTGVGRPGGAIAVRVDELPTTLSVNRSFERVRLRIAPRDCELATLWTPSSQPLVVTWEDEGGEVHETVGGDHDADLEIALIGHLDAACATG